MFLYVANTCKWQIFTEHTVHLLYKLAESHVMPRTNCQTAGCNAFRKQTRIIIFKIPEAKSGILEHENGKKNI